MTGLGHHPFLEAPEKTGRLIREFVRSTPGAPTMRPERARAAGARRGDEQAVAEATA
jgi:hypothetical protein